MGKRDFSKMVQKQTIEPDTSNIELCVNAHLSDYSHAREDYLEHYRTRMQIIILGLGAFSVGLPLLISQSQNITNEILIILLYAFVVIFSALAMQITSLTYEIALIEQYINTYLIPEINSLLKTSPNHAVVQYGNYSKTEFKKPFSLFMSLTNSVGILLLVIFPSTVALIGAQYGTLLVNPSVAAITTKSGLSAWITPISWLAWVSYIISIINMLGTLLYWLIGGKKSTQKMIEKKSKLAKAT